MAADVVDAAGEVAQEAEEHVHRGGLHVAPGFPSRHRVGPESEQVGEAGLGQVEALAQGADVDRNILR